MSQNRVIGTGGKLPWHYPEDLAHFKRLTMGHPVVMGRKTYESIGRLLPGRMNVILTKQKDFEVPGALVFGSLTEAIASVKLKHPDGELFVIGGAEIYKLAMSHADVIHLTVIKNSVDYGDAFFPEIDENAFWLESATAGKNPDLEYQTWKRK